MGLLKLKGKMTDGEEVGDRNGNPTVACCFWVYKILAFLRRRREGNHIVKCQQVALKSQSVFSIPLGS